MPVGAELAIHGSDLQHRWMVVVGHDASDAMWIRSLGLQPLAEKISNTLRAPALRQPAPIEHALGVAALGLIEAITAMSDAIAALKAELATLFEQHAQAPILTSFPGPVLGARLLGEFGDDPHRFTDSRGVRSFAGTASIPAPPGEAGWSPHDESATDAQPMAHDPLRALSARSTRPNQWRAVLCDKLGITDRAEAYRSLRAFLHLVRDRVTVDEAADFAPSFPCCCAACFTRDGCRPRPPAVAHPGGVFATSRPRRWPDRPTHASYTATAIATELRETSRAIQTRVAGC